MLRINVVPPTPGQPEELVLGYFFAEHQSYGSTMVGLQGWTPKTIAGRQFGAGEGWRELQVINPQWLWPSGL